MYLSGCRIKYLYQNMLQVKPRDCINELLEIIILAIKNGC